MSEFNDRVAAQRAVLRAVNQSQWTEPLFSLSSKAISRWIAANQLAPSWSFVSLVEKISARLFFLANKSQEQVTEEYRAASGEVRALILLLEVELLTYRNASP